MVTEIITGSEDIMVITASDILLSKSTEEALKNMMESVAEMSRRMDERDAKMARTEARLDHLAMDSGAQGQRLGQLVEFIVIPGIRSAMNSLGHHFKYASANKKVKAVIKGEKIRVAEVDIFLHNGTEAMAVEVKTCLSPEDVNHHVDRLAKLRKYQTEANIQGKTLYGAVVGLFIDDHARRFALKNGLYVLEIIEQENTLKTDAPKKCRVW
jgi:hypothetical protein